jgi:sugar-specific transcriptional regulator TrmB
MTDDFRSDLQELGLLPAEALVYLALIRNGALSGTAVASVTGYPRSSVYLTLNSLLDKGLIEGGPAHGSRFFVVPPDKALPSLVLQEKEAMAKREKIAAELGRRLGSLLEPTETTPDKLIQVIRSARGVAERYERLQLEAKRSNEVFVKAPFFVTPGNPAQEKASRHGVRVRAIYERAVLDVAAVKPYLATWVAQGEQVRIYDGALPHKLAIFDRQRALVHLTMPGDQMRTLYIGHPELAISLGIAFDALWESSKPLKNADQDTSSPDFIGVRARKRTGNGQASSFRK